MNLVGPLAFNEIRHIEINVAEVSDIILFHVLYVVGVEYELVSTITTEHDIRDIVDEIDANHGLKNAVETVAESPHVKLPIDLMKVPVIHVKLLLKLKPDMMRGQPVKESRQDNGPVLTPLRKQSSDVLITNLIQQCFMHHICESDPVQKIQRLQVVDSEQIKSMK